MKPKWIRVGSYKEIPVGNWLVWMDDDHFGNFVKPCCIKTNFQLIGDGFAFDESSRVVAYCEELEGPD
jgi:hypothetical protein